MEVSDLLIGAVEYTDCTFALLPVPLYLGVKVPINAYFMGQIELFIYCTWNQTK